MEKDNFPRFTVVIPTKDRADYLHHTLRTCSLQDYDNLEVVVSDDGSTDHTREVIEEASRKDPRIRYVTPGGSAGMWRNFEFALSQVKPGYVMALGGDDGLLPYGISEMRDILIETGQELLAWPILVYLYEKAKSDTSQLVVPFCNGSSRIIQSTDFLKRQAENLFYVADWESPMFYVKGVTSTSLIDRVRARSVDGRFYSCSTPDGYSGTVLAGEVSSYAYSGKPLSIFGSSPASQGLAYMSASESGKRASEAFFREAALRPMHAELGGLPYSPLITLMSADYLLTARDLPGWPGRFPPISYRNLLLKGLNELADGQYSGDRLARELGILNGVAEHHGLGEFFREQVKRARRNNRKALEGNAISTQRLYLDGSQYGIRDVFDAAYVAHYMFQFAVKSTPLTVWSALTNSVRYRLLSLRTGSRFPAESEWLHRGL